MVIFFSLISQDVHSHFPKYSIVLQGGNAEMTLD